MNPANPLFNRRSLIASSAFIAAMSALPVRPQRVAAAGEPTRPFPHHGTYAPGTIRPDHRTREELDNDVRSAYDAWKEKYCVEEAVGDDGNPRYRIAFSRPDTEEYAITVSEGQGYGMVIVPHLAGHDPDAQTIFDGLWRFVRDNPSAKDSRLMNWHVPEDPNGNSSAFDGDCDIAYGLLLADAQWGSDGEIDYRAAAVEVLAGMLESTIGPGSRYPTFGDWVDPNGEEYNQYMTRPSDFMLGHFRAFARVTDDEVWSQVGEVCQSIITRIQATASAETGLLPDFVGPVSADDPTPRPADPFLLEGPNDGAYSYNAGRTPWRIGTDAYLNNHPVSLAQIRQIATWAGAMFDGDPSAIRAGYTLDGEPLPDTDYFTTFFAAPFGVAAMSMPDQQEWLNAVYDAVVDQSENYYEDSVTLLCLLVMTGNFWDPTSEA